MWMRSAVFARGGSNTFADFPSFDSIPGGVCRAFRLKLTRPISAEIVLEFREVGGVKDAVQVGIQGDVVSRLARSARKIRFRAKCVLKQVEVRAIHDDFRTAVTNRGGKRVAGRISTAIEGPEAGVVIGGCLPVGVDF